MKKIIIVLFLISTCLIAQKQEGGSIYSRYGIGLSNLSANSKSLGMGGAGLASLDLFELSTSNPAAWSSIRSTNISAGFSFENISLNSSDKSNNFNVMNFDRVIFGVPLEKESGFAFEFGLNPFSRVGYNNVEKQIIGDLTPNVNYHGSGGLSELQFGLTYIPVKDLSFGIKTSYVFGTLRNSVQVLYNNSDYYNNEFDKSTYAHGFDFTGGIIYTGLKKLTGLRNFNIGLVFSPGVELNGRKELSSIYYMDEGVVAFDTTLLENGKIKIPGMFGLGVNLNLFDNLTFAADYLTKSNSNISILGVKSPEIVNGSRISAGIEYTPLKDEISAFKSLAYRLGFYSENLGIEINEKKINEIGITLGLGIPFSLNSYMNAALVLGQRGTKDSGLILERFVKLQLTYTIGELWFISTEE